MSVPKLFLVFLLPLIAECAVVPEVDPEGRIVGGYSAAPGQFPYQVSIQTVDEIHNCGGSIVSSSWILSSAHCAHDKEPGVTTAVVGSHLVSLGGVRYGLQNIVVHPDYDSRKFQNDIGMMKTDTSIIFTDVIQPIKIATTEIVTEIPAIASGWGTLAYPGAYANNLQYLPVTIIGNELCTNLHTTTNAAKLYPGVMCAQPIKGTGMCVGDTGSPLVANLDNVRFVQIGVVSWGVPCGANYPDVYTRLSSYIPWISEVSDAFFIERDEQV